jgi:hypothetical protein
MTLSIMGQEIPKFSMRGLAERVLEEGTWTAILLFHSKIKRRVEVSFWPREDRLSTACGDAPGQKFPKRRGQLV